MNENGKIKIVILAGGKGTRMNHDLPKVLVPLGGKPMVKHVIDTIKEIINEKPILIVGHKAELIQKEFGDTCDYAFQKEQLGTAHALMCAEKACGDAKEIIVLSGDQPFVKSKTITDSIEKFRKTKATMVLTTTLVPNFSDWCKAYLPLGRVLRKNGKIIAIREYKDASEEEKEIKEINTACCYVFNADWLWKNLKKVKNNNAKKEYYLTDLFQIASEENEKIETIEMDPHESLGANSKEDLEVLEKFVK
ncbi:MAG TPA: NTP transferase domain-containing protein [Candidatus Paceibacterota bacterium]|nr:NTP transferase domain-containing protein [Candidatus Paceibacterota bacterium]HPT17850.1 NTP transferase domain-containing protein [Candidatus Paceibacterota bacterium]